MTILRITSGALKGRKVPVPAHPLRPTSARARQAFFNILGDRIVDSVFLDLFCGSGIFTLEAVSRGARKAIAVDIEGRALRQLERTATEWSLPVTTVRDDAISALRRPIGADEIDIVFADPPWDFPRYRELAEAIDGEALLAPGVVIGIEHRSGRIPFERAVLSRLALRKTARYGDVSISIFEADQKSAREDEDQR
jgi:16S rRNA (guanine(966)-N(2))-methyltransferase RsmD